PLEDRADAIAQTVHRDLFGIVVAADETVCRKPRPFRRGWGQPCRQERGKIETRGGHEGRLPCCWLMTILNKYEAIVPRLAAGLRPRRRSALRIGAGADLRSRVMLPAPKRETLQVWQIRSRKFCRPLPRANWSSSPTTTIARARAISSSRPRTAPPTRWRSSSA